MEQLIIIIHVIVAVMLIGLVLLQHGKGADVGAAFGSGASNTMFGSQGALPFLMKVTALLAALFFATNLTLSYLVSRNTAVLQNNNLQGPASVAVPAVDKAAGTKQQQFVFPSVPENGKSRP